MLKINEIFHSIQGESSFSGKRTLFIRTTGCNLRCSYCDSKYSYYEGESWTLSKLLQHIDSYSVSYVCITGGEPLLQNDVYELMTRLCDKNYHVSLETSGSKSIQKVDPRVKIVLDVKTPDSGASDSFYLENLKYVMPSTEFKFVICSEDDFEWSEKFCRQYDLFEKFLILYSPSYNVINFSWLAEKILKEKSNAQLQLQLHKIIWPTIERGV